MALNRWPVAAILMAALVAATSTQTSAATGTVQHLAGSWRDIGAATFDGGQSERLRCTASYRSAAGGNNLSLAIRCASPSTNVELRASLSNQSGQVSGTWEERQFNVAGGATGRLTGSGIKLSFSGGLSGGMSVVLKGPNSHSVSIAAQGSGLRNVTMALNRR